MSIIEVTPGSFIDDEPVGEDDVKRELARLGAPPSEAPRFRDIYPYVQFHSLERASYGLVLTAGAPRGRTLDYEETGETGFENLAPLNDLDDAVENLERGDEVVFEEAPYAEILDEADYNRTLRAAAGEVDDEPEEWEPGKEPAGAPEGEPSVWDGPGVYDLRDLPPTKSWPSVEEYEAEAMDREASDLVDFMFQGDEWRDTLRDLVARSLGRGGGPPEEWRPA